jgi:hypothetical protein
MSESTKNVKNEITASEIVPSLGKSLDTTKSLKNDNEKKWKAERERKSKMVTGKFLFNECPNGELNFFYREFPQQPITTYTFRHDQIYTIPLGVAIHLNDRCSYDEYQYNLDNGKLIDAKNMYIKSKVHRTNFIPLDWSVDAGNSDGKSVVEATFTNPLDSTYNLDASGR